MLHFLADTVFGTFQYSKFTKKHVLFDNMTKISEKKMYVLSGDLIFKLA